MTAEAFMPSNGSIQSHYGFPSMQPLSPMSQSNPFESSMGVSSFSMPSERMNGRVEMNSVSAILMRKLPRNTSNEALRSMLLFAKDLIGAEFIPAEFPEDKGYLSAIARFRTPNAAQEARAMLDGKPNTAGETKMIVEVLQFTPGGSLVPKRNTLDTAVNRGTTSSSSSAGSSNGQANRQSSRYNGTFQSLDHISPPAPASAFNHSGGQSSGSLHSPDVISPFNNFFSPQSPIGQPLERQRVSGKSVIGEDGVDDETGELLKDPVAYAENDMAGSMSHSARRSTNSQLPASRFAGLSLISNNMPSPSVQGFLNSRTMQSPTPAMSPTALNNMGPNATYQLANQHYQRHNYPPANPADQNPPCNTLYVGNLPIDTSEDELKAMFSKQRGYKRLCFRTKQNGPMCFVEFEDVSFATKALTELYGHPLHNSVKGGIRLSFSKNPLGVRTGQPGGMGPPTPMSPQGPMHGINGIGGMQSFSTANGPPPGLTAPPGLSTSTGTNGSSMSSIGSPISGVMMSGAFGGGNFSMSGFNVPSMKSPPFTGNMPLPNSAGGIWNGQGGPFPDFMLGR